MSDDRHHHGHHHHHGHDGDDDSVTLALALGITLAVAIGEVAAGFWTGSLAVIADAWHMLSDAGSLGLALAATRLATRPRSLRKTFGYRRLEVLAALANGLLLAVVAVSIVREAWERLHHPEPVRGLGVIVTGTVTLIVNLAIAALLHRRSAGNLNVRAALAHVVGDAAGSGAAIIAGAVVLWTGETRADPLLSLLVAGLLLWSAWRLVRETAHILMEGTPVGFDPLQIEAAICSVPGVASVHDLHVWTIGAGQPAVSAHVVMGPGEQRGDQLARAVCVVLEQRFAISHSTIQPEPASPPLVPLGTPKRS
jgi:cobalt-zinc-cadmium efflux system protein